MRRYIGWAVGVAIAALLLASMATALLNIAAGKAEAHQQMVTLHNGNDAAWTGSGHHLLVVCDGTNNGHRFGAEVKLRNGNTPIRFDFGSGGECYDDSFSSEITAIRWVCHGAKGAWRNA